MFNKIDLTLYEMIMDEFATRHKTLSNKMEHTYNIGNVIRNYLEKQVILEYLLRGDSKEMEK